MKLFSPTTAANEKIVSQETLALLEILRLGNRDVKSGNLEPFSEVAAKLRSSQSYSSTTKS